jgi:hypothetical protein
MKYKFCVLLRLLVCVSSISAQRRSTREIEGLNGAVRSVRLKCYVISKTTGNEERGCGVTIDTYDASGNKSQIDHLAAGGFVERQVFLLYDANGRLTEEAEYFGPGILRQRTLYEYDDDNRIVEAQSYDASGSLSSRIVFKFERDYDLNDLCGLQGVDSFFRERGWLEVAWFDSKGSQRQRYNASNNDGWRELTFTSNDPTEGQRTSPVKTIHVFDAKGRIANQYRTLDGIPLSRTVNERVELTSEYEFDAQGNWTKRVFVFLGEKRVEYRTITYY